MKTRNPDKNAELKPAERKRCMAIFRRLSELVDGELSPEMCKRIKAHMKGCGNCESFFNTFRATVDLCHEDRPAELPRRARAKIAGRIRRLADPQNLTRK